MQALSHKIYRFEDFELDGLKRQLLRDGQPVMLQPKAVDLLLALVGHVGQLLTKDELLELVWPDQIVEESNLTVHMSALRKALGQSKGERSFVVTEPGRGYRFVADVRELEARAGEVVGEQRTLISVDDNHRDLAGEFSVEGIVSHQLRPPNENIGARLLNNKNGNGAAAASATTFPINAAPARPALPRVVWVFAGGLMICVLLALGGFAYWRSSVNRATTAGATPPVAPHIVIKRLTTQGMISHATLSPDGKFFVYVQKERDGQYGLWLSQVDGSSSVQLRAPAEVRYGLGMTFAPDGSSLYYCLNDGENPQGRLFRLPVLGGVPEKLALKSCSAMTFSPDGKQVGFVRTDRARAASLLMVANLDGSGEREIAARPLSRAFVHRTAAWSPDGSTITVGAVSKDNGENQEIFDVRVTDGKVEPLTALDWRGIQRLSWLSDGSRLIVVAADKDSWQRFSQLWSVTHPAGEARRLTSDLNSYGAVASLSADDGALLAVQAQSITNMWVASAKNFGQAKQITFGSQGRYDGMYGIDWTHDGRIVYVAVIGESRTIWRMDSDGGNARQLTSSGYADINPSLTADGRHLVFQSNRGGSYDIWRTDTDGGNPQQLTRGGGNKEPHVSPDGRWVVYVSSRDGLSSLWRVSVDGGEPVRLTDKPSEWPRISPDGKFIACGYVSDADSLEGWQIAVFSVEGGPPVKLFNVPKLATFRTGIRWTQDGAALTYRDSTNGIWRQPLSGGEPQRLPGLPTEKLFTHGWSRDGQQFAFTRGTESRDVVLIRDFR